MATGVTLNEILEQTKAALIAGVEVLDDLNTAISDEGQFDWPHSWGDYGCVIFYRIQDPSGFAGGLEMKEVLIVIAFVYVRTTDEDRKDFQRFRQICLNAHEKALDALQANFLTGSILDEALEYRGCAPGIIQTQDQIKIEQTWRCMHNDYLADRIATRDVIGP